MPGEGVAAQILQEPSYRTRLVEALAASSKSWSKEDREHIAAHIQQHSAAIAGRTAPNAYVALFLRAANEAIRSDPEFAALALRVWAKRQRKLIEAVGEAAARLVGTDALEAGDRPDLIATVAATSRTNPRDVALAMAVLALKLEERTAAQTAEEQTEEATAEQTPEAPAEQTQEAPAERPTV